MTYFSGITNNNYIYEANKPSVSRDGISAYFTVYIDDSSLEVDIDLGYDGHNDEVIIESVYSESESDLDTSDLDLEALFVEVSNKFGTIDKAYSLQAKAYHADHA